MTIIIPFPKRKIIKINKTVGVSQKIKEQLSDLQKQRQEIYHQRKLIEKMRSHD